MVQSVPERQQRATEAKHSVNYRQTALRLHAIALHGSFAGWEGCAKFRSCGDHHTAAASGPATHHQRRPEPSGRLPDPSDDRPPHAARRTSAPRTPMQHGRSLKAECANGLRFSRHNARQIMTFTVDARSTPRSRRLHDPFENMSIVHPHHLRTGGPTPPTRALPMFEPGIERGPRE